MAKGASVVDEILKMVEDELCWAVVVAFYLVGYDFAFFVYLVLRKCAVEDDVEDEFGCSLKVLSHEG